MTSKSIRRAYYWSNTFRSKYVLTTILVHVLPSFSPQSLVPPVATAATAAAVTSTTSNVVASTYAFSTPFHPLAFSTGVFDFSSTRLYSTRRSSSLLSGSSEEVVVQSSNNDNEKSKKKKKKKKSRYISFVTDIEGDKRYFDRFVENSSILEFEAVEPNLTPGLDFFPYERRVTFQRDENDCDGDFENKFCDETKNNADDVDNVHSILVFGGDVCDKGGNDLYVIRQLLSLKKRFHERVQFIMGNRDINKMRILQELCTSARRSDRDDNNDRDEILYPHGGVYWFRNTGLQGDPKLIDEWYCGREEQADIRNDNDNNGGEEEELLHSLIPDRAGERLKWILKKTMGSPDAFEFRRSELKQEKMFVAQRQEVCCDEEQSIHVSDEEVVESYRQTCHPVTGIMGKYLSQGKLCLVIGGAMFMHGSLPITPHALSKYHEDVLLAGRDNADARQEFWNWFFEYATPFKHNVAAKSVNEWVHEINSFSKQQNEAWTRNVTLSEEHPHGREGRLLNSSKPYNVFWSTVGGYSTLNQNSDLATEFGSLCQYGMGWLPDKSRNPTVVYNGWMVDGKPKYYNSEDKYLRAYRGIVEDFFQMAGLDVIVSGHQPVGDMPFPIQISNGCDGKDIGKRKFVICADTSYSGDTKWMNNNVEDGRQNLGRGISVSGRGDFAVSEILLEQECDTLHISSISFRGTLSDGSHHESINYLEGDANYIGKPVDRNIFSFEGSIQDDSYDNIQWYVKSKLHAGHYLVSTGKGYEVYNSVAKIKKE